MKKKLVQINVVCNGSTGRIMCDIAKKATEEGFEAYCFYGRGNPNKDVNCIKIGNKLSVYYHVFLTRLFNLHGHGSYFATKKMIKQIKNIDPDVIHLHNIHGYYLNFKVLFKYLKSDYKGKIIWTLHDCWAFTGHCAHFTVAKCNKWKNCCGNCPQIKSYPKSLFIDNSKKQFLLKKEMFSNIENLIIVTPSNWLKSLVEKSFLGEYEIKVINNGIDTNIFKPTYDERIYDKYNIPKGQKIILGVANNWYNKGLNYFLNLNNVLSSEYTIVLVGVNNKQLDELPKNIVGVIRTDNINDLVNIYSISTVLFNPSHEETFSKVTIEAKYCGTSVIVFDTTAPKEIIDKTDCLIKNALNKTENEISKEVFEYISKNLKEPIINNKKYDKDIMISNHLLLYK
ncbi:MAG: glycosyltransferase [Bacilli bacterium]|nr:glycosyltransferase [Bacilli bacterium]